MLQMKKAVMSAKILSIAFSCAVIFYSCAKSEQTKAKIEATTAIKKTRSNITATLLAQCSAARTREEMVNIFQLCTAEERKDLWLLHINNIKNSTNFNASQEATINDLISTINQLNFEDNSSEAYIDFLENSWLNSPSMAVQKLGEPLCFTLAYHPGTIFANVPAGMVNAPGSGSGGTAPTEGLNCHCRTGAIISACPGDSECGTSSTCKKKSIGCGFALLKKCDGRCKPQ
jgi:hypothetical protein